MIHELLEGSERCSTSNEEAAIVKLANSVMLDGVAIPHGEREVISSRLGITD